MIKQTTSKTSQHEVEENAKSAESFPDGYRIAQSRGYYYPQRQVDDVWLYFPANGPLPIEQIGEAKWFREYTRAENYLRRYIASEQQAWESGLFDGIPTTRKYDYSGLSVKETHSEEA